MTLLTPKNSAWKTMERVCHPIDSSKPELTPDVATVHCGPEKVDGFDFPVDPTYPLVGQVTTECSEGSGGMLFVNDAYVAGRRPGKKNQVTFSVTHMLPWYQQAIDRWFVPDGWTLNKNWFFESNDGKKIPFVAGIEIDFDTGTVVSGDVSGVAERFERARAMLNVYVGRVMSSRPDEQNGDIPNTVDETYQMMYNMRVPGSLMETAARIVYGNTQLRELSDAEKKQALMIYMASKLKVPAIVFNGSSFSLPK